MHFRTTYSFFPHIFCKPGFPNVIGAVDCTHVVLRGVALGAREPQFINRKGQHSLNVQVKIMLYI